MIAVYKYIINHSSKAIEIPDKAEILTVAFQGEDLCFWAKVDTDNVTRIRNFQAFGTGHKIPFQMGVEFEFVGTGFMDNGLVFHLFESVGL